MKRFIVEVGTEWIPNVGFGSASAGVEVGHVPLFLLALNCWNSAVSLQVCWRESRNSTTLGPSPDGLGDGTQQVKTHQTAAV